MILRIVLLGWLLGAQLAWAGLDGPPLPATGPITSTPATTAAGVAYTRIERTLPDGVQLDEFVDAGGNVFAVGWSGPFKPDLRQLLGPHFDAYRKAAQVHRQRRSRSLSVDTGDVVVLSQGRMGAFQGRAWVPAGLPAGFDTQEFK